MRRDSTRRTQAALTSGAVLLLVGWPSPALAHGVVLDHEQVDAVRVEAHYDSGAPMVDAQVTVYSPEDSSDPWASGSVDDEGTFHFTPDDTGTWQVEVRQAGHGDTLRIEIEDESPDATEEAAEAEQGSDGQGSDGQASDEQGRTTEAADTEEATAPEGPAGASGANTTSGGGPLNSGPLQMVVTGALAVWALVMTALYFAARKRT